MNNAFSTQNVLLRNGSASTIPYSLDELYDLRQNNKMNELINSVIKSHVTILGISSAIITLISLFVKANIDL